MNSKHQSAIIFTILLAGAIQLRNTKTLSMPDTITPQMEFISVDNERTFDSLQMGEVICYRPSESKLAILQNLSELSPLAARFSELYKIKDYHNCHRIVAKNNAELVAQGDAIFYPDPYFINSSEYLGVVK